MSKFSVGEIVDNAADDHEGGKVIAVFPTVDGSFRYAVDTHAPVFQRRKIGRSSQLGLNRLYSA